MVLECDSRRHHTIESDRANDVAREGPLRADGWHLERLRWRDITGGREAQTVARIAAVRRGADRRRSRPASRLETAQPATPAAATVLTPAATTARPALCHPC